jgi:hypothetical protein
VTFQGAKIKGHGIPFAIAIVQLDVITNGAEADRMITAFGVQVFKTGRVVLMARDPQGSSTYYGRADVVRSLASIDVSRIAWMEYTI